METRTQWFRRMASRLRLLLECPEKPVSQDEALSLIVAMVRLRDVTEVDPFPPGAAPVTVDGHSFERLANQIRQHHRITLDPGDLVLLLLTPGDPVQGKVRKSGPFALPRVTSEYPWFAHLLLNAIKQLPSLPDFSDDTKVFVMSDFSGEHRSALYNTYSFIILAQDKIGPFQVKVRELREKHGLLNPYSEFAYKDLRFGARSRALPEFLDLVDNYIHGAVITLAVEKRIETLFGPSKPEAHAFLVDQLASLGFGQWKGPDAEKVSRVCHTLAVFVSLLTSTGQRLLWYCDNDTINVDGKRRTFAHTQELFKTVWGMYATQPLDVIGFGRSFEDKSYLDDLLSVADLAAGVVQDLLQGNATGADISGGDEKLRVIRWAASPARFLSKINIQICRMENGEVGSGLVAMNLKDEQPDLA